MFRVEDLDASRVRSESIPGAIDDVRWLGLDWDEGPDVGGPSSPYVQSQRSEHYSLALDRLKSLERVYPCTCTRAEIARVASAPHAEDEGPSYPGTCSGRSATDASTLVGRSFAWRFRVPSGVVEWDDLFQGSLSVDPSVLGGDFLVARENQGPAYQLAVVVDDAAMGVNQVVRGEDLVTSTPRQILLYRALCSNVPEFGHLALVFGPDGRRLAKRDNAIKLSTLREAGVDPRCLIGWLALSLGLTERFEAIWPRELVNRFSAKGVSGSPFVVSPEALENLIAGRSPR